MPAGGTPRLRGAPASHPGAHADTTIHNHPYDHVHPGATPIHRHHRPPESVDQIAKNAPDLAGNAIAAALHKGLWRDVRGATTGLLPVLHGGAHGGGHGCDAPPAPLGRLADDDDGEQA